MLFVSALLCLGVAALSAVPYTPKATDRSILRLSWRFRAGSVAECRPVTEAERSALPIHMQRDTICEGKPPPFRLTVHIDGRVLEDVSVVAAGARRDRPVSVYREYRLEPGSHDVGVRFRVAEEVDIPGSDVTVTGGGLPDLELASSVVLAPGEIVLVTFDEAEGRLVLRTR
jgi:hypothetical protein